MRDKRKKFVELAEARVNRAIKDIRLIGNLANKSAYDYGEEDAKQIFKALQKELDAAKSRFTGNAGGRDSEFRLGE
jgi:ABC-type Fe3+-hydroxamate transport system substrate-binding protein